jgi:hypothetical protein
MWSCFATCGPAAPEPHWPVDGEQMAPPEQTTGFDPVQMPAWQL